MSTEDKGKILHEFDLFKNVSDAQLSKIAQVTALKHFSGGSMLIDQSILSDEVYFITEGTVKVYLLNEDGKEINLAILGPGNTIGEISTFVGRQRTAFCEAIDNVTTLVLSGGDFRLLTETEPQIATELIRYFAQRIIQSNKRVNELVTKSLKDRTWQLLKTLAQTSKKNVLDITQETLANILSATRPRVSEALKELEVDKKIAVLRHEIKIL